MMDINDGKFSMNGNCGYVLKPEAMRNEVIARRDASFHSDCDLSRVNKIVLIVTLVQLQYFDAEAKTELPGVASKILHLRIISGQNFPKPRGGGESFKL